MVTWMSLNAARMVLDRSWRGMTFTDGGSCDSNVGSSARTASVTSMVLVPGWRMTCSVIARCCSGLPSGFV
jgi:hypothetical protein